MEKMGSRLAAAVFIVLVGFCQGIPLCGIDTSKLDQCRSAVTGVSPPLPTNQCCNLVGQANLPCLCGFKFMLPAFGLDPALTMTLPSKCGVDTPPQCHCKLLNLVPIVP